MRLPYPAILLLVCEMGLVDLVKANANRSDVVAVVLMRAQGEMCEAESVGNVINGQREWERPWQRHACVRKKGRRQSSLPPPGAT